MANRCEDSKSSELGSEGSERCDDGLFKSPLNGTALSVLTYFYFI